MPTCPDGHNSTSTDFCDVCGLAMNGAAGSAPISGEATGGGSVVASSATPAGTVAPLVEPPVGAGEVCPECGEPRTGRFCEGCSYDFVAGTSHAPAQTATPTVVSAPSQPSPPAGDTEPAVSGWAVVVGADRGYFEKVQAEEGPDAADIVFPAYCPEQRFALSGTEMRIGRLSRSRNFEPEIDLVGPPLDPGVSHLHAVLLAQPDGGWALVDPGSTNGTTINDDTAPIRVNEAVPLRPGDRIHVGAWTTITVHGPDDD